jgi:hypothetical protein
MKQYEVFLVFMIYDIGIIQRIASFLLRQQPKLVEHG